MMTSEAFLSYTQGKPTIEKITHFEAIDLED